MAYACAVRAELQELDGDKIKLESSENPKKITRSMFSECTLFDDSVCKTFLHRIHRSASGRWGGGCVFDAGKRSRAKIIVEAVRGQKAEEPLVDVGNDVEIRLNLTKRAIFLSGIQGERSIHVLATRPSHQIIDALQDQQQGGGRNSHGNDGVAFDEIFCPMENTTTV
jgi:hypothetical protein